MYLRDESAKRNNVIYNLKFGTQSYQYKKFLQNSCKCMKLFSKQNYKQKKYVIFAKLVSNIKIYSKNGGRYN